MKKLFVLGAFLAAAFFAVSYFFAHQEPKEYAVGSPEWKYYTAEAETKVRPATYDEMKWHEPAGPELRSPASRKNK